MASTVTGRSTVRHSDSMLVRHISDCKYYKYDYKEYVLQLNIYACIFVCFYSDTELNRGLSFGTIAAVGANGAIIHYSPSNATDKQITTSELFLLDSGGQYL